MSLPYTQTRWSLADLFPGFNSPELEQAFTDLEAKVADFEALRPQLSPDISKAHGINGQRNLSCFLPEDLRH